MQQRERRTPGTHSTDRRHTLWSAFLAAFVVGGLFFGYLFYVNIRDIVAYADLPFVLSGPLGAAHGNGTGGPGPISQQRLTGRVNILFLGIDRRDNEPGPWRTDTMILFSLDPVSNSASMLSIPRDLWVRLPDYDFDERINSAHVYGDQYRFPGGGPAYAKKAVQYNLGVPVHYYVRLDFGGFVKIVDAIGGIDIEVREDIVDDAYPTPDFGTEPLFIPAGHHHMNGELALKYARTRHSGSDIDRARRQQQVILAVRDKVLSLNFPVARIPEQLRILGDSLKTDMNIEEVFAVAQAARQVPVQSIQSGVIDEDMVIPWKTPDGWDVLVPKRDRIRELVTRLFPPPTPQVSLVPLGDRDKLAQEAARIEVQNGTQVPGFASRLATELRSEGFNVVRYGNADRFDYSDTVILYYVDKKYTIASLTDYLKVSDTRVVHESVASADVDIRVILGSNLTARR